MASISGTVRTTCARSSRDRDAASETGNLIDLGGPGVPLAGISSNPLTRGLRGMYSTN